MCKCKHRHVCRHYEDDDSARSLAESFECQPGGGRIQSQDER